MSAAYQSTDVNALSMRWRHLLFAHWSVDPSVVAPRIPSGVELDTYAGDAWLGVVPFVMDVSPPGLPAEWTFAELNLRTYVTDGDTPGVYFFNLDASDRLGVWAARTFFRLPYFLADARVERRGAAYRYESRRVRDDADARFDASYEPRGDPFVAAQRSLEAFLVERYRFYTTPGIDTAGRPSGRILYCDVDHEPWTLRRATADVRENELFAANGFEHPNGGVHLLFADELDVTADRIRRL